jgi:hypothetical protein
LGWYQNKGVDTYYNNGYADFFDNAVNALNTIHSDRKNGRDLQKLRQQRETAPIWLNEGTVYIGSDGKSHMAAGNMYGPANS